MKGCTLGLVLKQNRGKSKSEMAHRLRNFFFPDMASVHTHAQPANSAPSADIFESALQSGKKINPQRIR